MLGGIKKHGLGGAVSKQLGQWSEVVVAQAEKMEGGVEKHGLEGAVVKQVDAWISPEEQSKREAEEREELRRKAEAEARDLREREEFRRREVEERELRDKEELQKALQISRAEAEERELREREGQKKIEAEKLSPKKIPFKDFIYKFLERDPKIDDDKAFAAMEKIKSAQEMGDAALAQLLFSVQDHSINNQVIKWFTTTDVIGDSDVFDL